MAQPMTAQKGQTNEPFQMKEGQINIFKNENQDVSRNQPDYWGKCVIDGVEKKISLWKNTSKTGNQYLGGQVEDYQPNNGAPQVSASQESAPF